MTERATTAQALEALTKLRTFVRKYEPGGCHILSTYCRCALCLLDELAALSAVSQHSEISRQDKLLVIAGLVNAYHNDGTTLTAAETVKAIAETLGDPFEVPAVSPQGTGEALLDSMRTVYGLPPDATVKDFLDAAKASKPLPAIPAEPAAPQEFSQELCDAMNEGRWRDATHMLIGKVDSLHRQLRELRVQVLAVVDTESELEGPMPESLREAFGLTPEDYMRAAVRATKVSIRAQLAALLAPSTEPQR